MNYQRMKKDEFLYRCGLIINNALNDEAIKTAVANFGYPPEKLQPAKTLLDECISLSELFEKEHGEVDSAFAARDAEKQKANETYKKCVAIAGVALKANTGAIATLQLNGKRATTLSGWLKQTRNFYKNLLANAEWLSAMATFGISEAILQEGLKEVQNVDDYAAVIMREKGDAQNATKQRDAKMEELADWVNDFEIIARIALASSPQLMEKLGIVVKS